MEAVAGDVEVREVRVQLLDLQVALGEDLARRLHLRDLLDEGRLGGVMSLDLLFERRHGALEARLLLVERGHERAEPLVLLEDVARGWLGGLLDLSGGVAAVGFGAHLIAPADSSAW